MSTSNKAKMAGIVKLIKPYTALYPTCKLDTPGLMLYARALMPLQLDIIEAAMAKLLQTSTFFPTVAEVFKAADEMESYAKREVTGEYTPSASEAWQEVESYVKRYGVYHAWPYSCQEVKAAAERFGVYELCSLEMSAVSIARAQFMRIYEEVLQQSKARSINQRAINALGPQRAAALISAIAGIKQIADGEVQAL